MPANDLTIYSEFAHEWWKAGSPHFRSLQNLTPFRLSLIEEMLGPVNGKAIADLGCGGGLLSIPLLNSGASVSGIDLSANSIEAAKDASNGRGNFSCGNICSTHFQDNTFDIVLLADVLDHIKNYEVALKEAHRILKIGGKLFVGTINRNFLSWFFAIFLGEGLKLIPRGTHDYNLFITPRELIDNAISTGFRFIQIQGEAPNLLKTISSWAISLKKSNSLAIAYTAIFEKTKL